MYLYFMKGIFGPKRDEVKGDWTTKHSTVCSLHQKLLTSLNKES
jgi:hypothetical protein